MVDDLRTNAGCESVLAQTSDYDVERDVAKCKRHIAALRRKIQLLPSSSGRDGQSVAFNLQVLQEQLRSAIAWLNANESRTESQRLSNPSVTHADFSTFRGYGG